MRVALLQLRVTDTPFPPFGIMYLGAVLEREGHDVTLLHPGPTEDDTVAEALREVSPDLVGFTLLTVQYNRLKRLLPQLRQTLPSARFCAGGVHATALPEVTLRDLNLDFVVLGEGEETLTAVCRRLEKGHWVEDVPGVAWLDDGGISVTEPRPLRTSLDELPLPARHLLDMEQYLRPPGLIKGYPTNRSTSVLGSRGCPHRCIFCGSHLIFGRRMRTRSVESVLGEIAELVDRYGIESLFFSDDTIGEDFRWLNRLSTGILSRGFRLEWSCQLRGKPFPEEVLLLMRRSGCVQVEFGVETGSDRLLRFLKKGVTREDLTESFRRSRNAGLRTLASFMVGLPGETQDDLLLTLDLLTEIRPDFSNFFLAVPYPGTELHALAERQRWLRGYPFGEAWFMRQSSRPLLLQGEEADRALRWRSGMQNRVLLRNYSGYLRRPDLLSSVMVSAILQPHHVVEGITRSVTSGRLDDLLEALFTAYVNRQSTARRPTH